MTTSSSQQFTKLITTLEKHLDELTQNSAGCECADDLFAIGINHLPSNPTDPSFPQDVRLRMILKTYRALQNPKSTDFVVRFLESILEPVPLAIVLNVEPPVDLAAGLSLDTPQFHKLTLSLLDKADEKSAEKLASLHRDVYEALVTLYLLSQTTGTAAKAQSVLTKLMRIGGGLVLRRLFTDKNIYELFLELKHDQNSLKEFSKQRKSIAQARFLDWLGDVSEFSWQAISISHHPELEKTYKLTSGKGLLDFAALHMVDYENDILIYQCLLRFYSKLLWGQKENVDYSGNSRALEYLVINKIHARILDIFVSYNDDSQSTDTKFIIPNVAEYLAIYIPVHQKHFLADKSTVGKVLTTIENGLNRARTQDIVDESSAVVNLSYVLQSIPRRLLVSLEDNNPIYRFGTLENTSATVIETLAIVFQGPYNKLPPFAVTNDHQFGHLDDDMIETDADNNEQIEIASSKTLFQSYFNHFGGFLNQIIIHCTDFTNDRLAIASNGFMRLLITSQWDVLSWFNSKFSESVVLVKYMSTLPEVIGSPSQEMLNILTARFMAVKAGIERATKENRDSLSNFSLKEAKLGVDKGLIMKSETGQEIKTLS